MLATAPLSAAPFTALRDGEMFTYKVGFAIFSHAGNISIAARHETVGEQKIVRITNDTRSRGVVRSLYAFDNHAEVIIDRETGRLQSVKETGTDPKRSTDSDFILDYPAKIARYTDRVRTARSVELAIPDGDPVDLISALIQTRDWELKIGEKRDVVVQFGRDFFELSIYADHYEEVWTPRGTFKTLVLIPRMEKNPKGLFKKGGEIKVWISQDASRLPVKMQLKLNFGTATLLLSKYQAAK
jgi:Protein of unknown function (DUF3108)